MKNIKIKILLRFCNIERIKHLVLIEIVLMQFYKRRKRYLYKKLFENALWSIKKSICNVTGDTNFMIYNLIKTKLLGRLTFYIKEYIKTALIFRRREENTKKGNGPNILLYEKYIRGICTFDIIKPVLCNCQLLPSDLY